MAKTKKKLIMKYQIGALVPRLGLPIEGLDCSYLEVKGGWVYYFK